MKLKLELYGMIAEQFGTLETLYPGRIDLGLGRAPGTDMATARALRRHMAPEDSFPQDVQELLASSESQSNTVLILGGGSNVLLTRDYNGLVLKNDIPGNGHSFFFIHSAISRNLSHRGKVLLLKILVNL